MLAHFCPGGLPSLHAALKPSSGNEASDGIQSYWPSRAPMPSLHAGVLPSSTQLPWLALAAGHQDKANLAVATLVLAAVADGATRLAGPGCLRVLRSGAAAQQGCQPGTAGGGCLVSAGGATAAEALEGVAACTAQETLETNRNDM